MNRPPLLENMIKDLLEHPKVIILFGAPWCTACGVVHGILDSLLSGYADIIYSKLDVTEPDVREFRNSLGVRGLPTVILFHNGEPKLTIIGSRKRHVYLKEIKWLGRL